MVCRSEAQAEGMFRRVLEEHPFAEVREYVEAELVGPPRQAHAQHAKAVYRDKVRGLWATIRWTARSLLEDGQPLPEGLERCPGYEEKDPDPEYPPDEWMRDRHNNCKHCEDGLRLVGMTPEELYAKRGAVFEEEQARAERTNHKPRYVRVFSRAEPAKDDEPLWAAIANHGHHADGTYLRELSGDWSLPEEPDCMPWFMGFPVLFFFRKVRDLDTTRVAGLATAARDAIKRDRERAQRRRDEEAQREKAERAERLRKLLG